ncbi:hypothetical protein PENSTE_c031G05563 [Penicillium steckii]|uniref:Zn(2)-C6 fungal-type domain-containing protein n=1 Tax=Penicillium steckii TaxID=303698 RepID=A0A1V6SLI9_9EURO|nr:hypothetical protein PENSTE_c031G05563 [Penicillium steckii]
MNPPVPRTQDSNPTSERSRKVRCSGDRPSCSRCITSQRVCTYSRQLPLGRPKDRRRVQKSRRNVMRNTNTPLVGSNQSRDPLILSTPTTGPPVSYESHPSNAPGDQQAFSIPSTEVRVSASTDLCACLSVLYLLLAELRTRDVPVIAKDLPALRKSVKAATEVLYCEQCPRYYFSVIQNGIVLGALCLCLAEFYNRIVDTIEAEAKQMLEKNETRRLSVSEIDVASQLAHDSTKPNGLEQSTFFVEMTAFDWRNLMRHVVKAEIYGVEGHRDTCFMTLVQRLEDRQRSWHQTPPSPDCPPLYRSACNPGDRMPTCLMMLQDVRRLIAQVEF